MESLTWSLCFLAIVTWLWAGIELIRRPPPVGPLPAFARRVLWSALCIAALVGGSWGPEVWSTNSTSQPRAASGAELHAETTREIRAPFARKATHTQLDAEDRVLRSEQRTSLHVPFALLGFLGLVSLLRLRAGPGAGARAGVATGVLLLGLAACAPEQGGEEAPRPERVVVEAGWDTLLHVTLGAEDTLLYEANHMAASDAGVWVLDRIGYRVARFDWNGRFRWYAGRQGSGPGEFTNPRMIALDRSDRVWILDVGNQRITGFDPDGKMFEEVPLRDVGGVLRAFATDVEGERFFGMLLEDRLRPVEVDRDGRVTRGAPIGFTDQGGAMGIALQGTTVNTGRGRRWIYAFTMGDGLFRMDGTDLEGARFLFPEAVPFSHMVEQRSERGDETVTVRELTEPNFSAGEIAVAGGEILVRFHGTSENAGRLLDVYDLESGAYRETVLLPATGRIAAHGDRVLLARHDPAPEILVLRRR